MQKSLEPKKVDTETLWYVLQLKTSLWKMLSPDRRRHNCCSEIVINAQDWENEKKSVA